MKIRLTEKQIAMLQELGEAKTYVANFEIVFDAASADEAVAKLEIMKQQIVQATKNAEVTPSLYEKTPFGAETKRIK